MAVKQLGSLIMIPIYEPFINKKEINLMLKKCIDENWISSQGSNIKRFENKLAKFHNVKHALVTTNCTSALHLSLLCLDLKRNDEILCPALTFIAPANMVILSQYKLKLVDIDKKSLTLDIVDLKKKITSNTKAIIVVHQFGHSADMDEILFLAKKFIVQKLLLGVS